MAILDNDRRSYAARHDEGDDREERRGAGHDRDSGESARRRYGRNQGGRYGHGEAGGGDRHGGYPGMGGGRSQMSPEHRWHGPPPDHDERHGDVESDRGWYGGRNGEDGGGRYGMSHDGSRPRSTRYRDSAYGDDDAYGHGANQRDRRDRDVERDFAGQGDSGGHGWYGGEHSWYGGEHSGSGVSGSGRGAGCRTGGVGRGSFRPGGEAMGMAAGLERGHDMMGHDMTGKGPKGYIRPDDRIREDVCDRLTDDPHLDASSIEVQVRNGEVTLSGSVDSRDARRHAEDLAERASGVKNVQSILRVQPGSEAGGTGATIGSIIT